MKIFRTRLLRFLLPAAVILGIAGAVAWRLSGAAPSWYRPPNVSDPRIAQLADDVEYRIVEEVHRFRDEPFTIRLREEHANAWLAARLPRWVAGRGWDWPSALGTPQVHLTAGGIDLAGDVETAGGRRWLVAHLQPRMEDGQVIVSITGVSIGRASLGAAPVDGLLSMLAPEKKAELLESELGSMLMEAIEDGAALEPIIRLADGRLVRILGISMNSGSVDLTLAAAEDDAEGGGDM